MLRSLENNGNQKQQVSHRTVRRKNWEKFQILNRLSWLAFGKVISMEKATGYYHVRLFAQSEIHSACLLKILQ